MRNNSANNPCRRCDHRRNAPNGICNVNKGLDGYDVRCVGEWARDKYYYLHRYIDVFATAMYKKWCGNIYYVDLFAGCGICRVRDTGKEIYGSALISLNIGRPFKRYFFIDKNPKAINALRLRIRNSPLRNIVELIEGDCNEKIEQILREIPKGCLCLAVIDPTGLQIKFETLRKLTANRRVDLFIVFPEGMAIKRNLKKFIRQEHSILDDFMPNREWRNEYQKIDSDLHKRERKFIQLYKEGLMQIGYTEFKSGEEISVRSTSRRLRLYYILFASKHPLGLTFWAKISEKEPNGQQKLKFNNPKNVLFHHFPKNYKQLDGKLGKPVDKVNDGSIIKRFDKTPLPQKATDIVCPHFLELKWAYGCPYDCAWCYLKGTFRFRPNGTLPVIKDYDKIELHTKKFLEEVKTPEILNTGEIADSLMHESVNRPFSKFIIPIFETQRLHKVLFLTKSSNVNNLLEIESHNQAIISFSLNTLPVAERWEKAPLVLKRIEAAKKVFDAGYEVRIRIDPIVPIENWQKYYLQLIDIIFDNLTPERITLGSLRGLQSTINGCTDKSWVKYLKESSNWGKKIDFKTRYNMYSTIIQQLKLKYNFEKIALCKETVQMWNALNMEYKKIRCNCVW